MPKIRFYIKKFENSLLVQILDNNLRETEHYYDCRYNDVNYSIYVSRKYLTTITQVGSIIGRTTDLHKSINLLTFISNDDRDKYYDVIINSIKEISKY